MALVVVFHLWPQALPGGFVGVDAFFVISGYLISAHLKKELDATGTIRLGEFWARRARRLLPASFTVLFICLGVTWCVVPLSLWANSLKDCAGAAFYALNWILAVDAVDYSASEESASPVQHFWSLSVEEQFYLVWPIVIVCASALAIRFSGKRLRFVRASLLAIVAGSLLASVVEGWSPDAPDYFVTWNRAWEFGAGALLAFSSDPKAREAKRDFVGLLAALVLIASAFVISEKTPFPGSAALVPVVATVLALRFGQGTARFRLEKILDLRPVQWVGDASYSIYLWHWPLIIFSNELPDRIRDTFAIRLSIIPLTLVLAWLSKRYIEDSVRNSSILVRKGPWPTFALTASAMGVTLMVVLALHEHASAARTERHPWVKAMQRRAMPCLGANTTPNCVNSELNGRLIPEPWAARSDHQPFCMANNRGDETPKVCRRGRQGKGVRLRTAVAGDSHAAHWSATFEQGAKQRGEQVIQLMKGSCPFSMSERESAPLLRKSCEVFKKKIWAVLRSDKLIHRLVLSASSFNQLVERHGLDDFESASLGYEEMLLALPPHIKEVIVMRDVPRPRPDVIQCLERLDTDLERLAPGACARSRERALLPDPLADAARRVGGRVHVIDFTDAFCDSEICSPVIGNVLAYRDGHHLSGTMAQSFGPRLRRELKRFSTFERKPVLSPGYAPSRGGN